MRVGIIIAAFCVGCAVLPSYERDASLRTAALQDAYLVAHGMAASYAQSPNANPDVVLQLARLDLRAAAAMRDHDSDATEQAVAALTAFAARQSDAGPVQ